MILQLEDVVDCLDALHSTPWNRIESPHNVFVKSPSHPETLLRKYEYVFLTDHSCGHDGKRADGLDVGGLKKGPTSASRSMRDVQITNEIGVLSEDFDHSFKLKVRVMQKLVSLVILIILATLRQVPFGGQARFKQSSGMMRLMG